MDILSHVGTNLKSVKNLRFEWSLKIARSGVIARPEALFWITNYNNSDISDQYRHMHNLLGVLDCPPRIVDQARKLAPISRNQGVLVSLDECSSKTKLFIEYTDPVDAQQKRVAFKWSDDSLPEEISYEFEYFKTGGYHALISLVHPDYRSLVNELLREPRLRSSGYYLQKNGPEIKEVYITYPWHPQLNEVSPLLEAHLNGIDTLSLSGYNDHFYRHIGFSVGATSDPAVTIYFSAGFNGLWPSNFEAFQEVVKIESRNLNERISYLKRFDIAGVG